MILWTSRKAQWNGLSKPLKICCKIGNFQILPEFSGETKTREISQISSLNKKSEMPKKFSFCVYLHWAVSFFSKWMKTVYRILLSVNMTINLLNQWILLWISAKSRLNTLSFWGKNTTWNDASNHHKPTAAISFTGAVDCADRRRQSCFELRPFVVCSYTHDHFFTQS